MVSRLLTTQYSTKPAGKKKNITEADITPEARLVQDLKLDSLDFAELLVLTEEILSADVTHDDLKQLTTIASVVAFFDQHAAKK